MFCLEFLNNLQQPFGNNPWPTHPTNQNYKMQFHTYCDYLFKFQAKRRINESILLRKWPKNAFNIEDNAYKTQVLAYSKELDLLILAINIIRSDVEEENSPPYPKDVMIDSKDETMNLEDTTPVVTLQFIMGSNELIDPRIAFGSNQFVQNKS